MRHFLLLGVSITFHVFSFAQQIQLRGQVSIHNSKHITGEINYVKGAEISALSAKPKESDQNGNFTLTFIDMPLGTPIKIRVKKYGFSVVNEPDLERVIVGQKNLLRISMIDEKQSEKLAEEQIKLYNINIDALTRKKNDLINRMRSNDKRALEELEIYLGHPINDRFEAEKELIERIESIQRRLPEFTERLVQTNLDFASGLYIKAYDFTMNGDIESAILVLDGSVLKDTYNKAIKSLTKGKELQERGERMEENSITTIFQTRDSYRLKALGLEQVLNFNEANKQYAEIIAIYENTPELFIGQEKDIILDYYSLSKSLAFNGDYSDAIIYQLKMDSVLAKDYNANHPIRVSNYNNMAKTYSMRGSHEEALKIQNKALNMLQQHSGQENSILLADAYSNMALILNGAGNSKEAIKYQLSANSLSEQFLESTDDNLAVEYGNTALIYLELGDYIKAIELQKKAINIFDENHGVNNPNIAIAYNNIALSYLDLEEFNLALEFQNKALSIWERIFGDSETRLNIFKSNKASIYNKLEKYKEAYQLLLEVVPNLERMNDLDPTYLADSYNEKAFALMNLGQVDQALQVIKRAIRLRKETLHKFHPKLGESYNTLGAIYFASQNYEKSINSFTMAIGIQEKSLDSYHPDLASSYSNIAQAYLANGNLKEAMIFDKKSLKIREKILPPGHFDLATSYNSIGINHLLNKNYPMSLNYIQKAVIILERDTESNYLSLAPNYFVLAFLLRNKDKLKSDNYLNQVKVITSKLSETARNQLQTEIESLYQLFVILEGN